MPSFTYKALDAGGKSISGTLDAADRKQALARLKGRRYQPLKLVQKGSSGEAKAAKKTARAGREPAEDTSEEPNVSFASRLKGKKDLALGFFRKLQQLHRSGMPVGDAVALMTQRMTDPNLKALSEAVYRDLSEGRTLASSVRSAPETFDATTSYLIEAGEATGNLTPIIENIILKLEQQNAFKRSIQGALAYPLMLLAAAVIVVLLFLFHLKPQLLELMATLGLEEMHWAAEFTIALSEFAVTWGPFILLGLGLGGIALLRYRATEKGRYHTDSILLRLPLVAHLARLAETVRISNVLGILLRNGVNTTESLRLTENVVQNKVFKERFRDTRNLINDGATFSNAFKRHEILSDTDIDILAVGENTGSMVTAFDEIYQSHASLLEKRLKLISSAVAGLALAAAVLVVFFLAIGMVMSVIDVSNQIMTR